MAIIAFIIVYILVKLINATNGVGETTPHTQQKVAIIQEVEPRITQRTHTLSPLKGGEVVARPRDRPQRNLREEYKRWKDNVRAYDRLRSKIVS